MPREVLEIAEVIVFPSAAKVVTYTGFVFNGMGYEYSIGVVAHRDRAVQVVFAETADEAAAKKVGSSPAHACPTR